MARSIDRNAEERLINLLRDRVLAGIHTARLQAGTRLPSYREVADETGADLRGVARAYAVLETEGLVEVRGRSGVFVARQTRVGDHVLAETARWFASVVREGWTRRIRVGDLPAFAQACTGARTVRCAFVESTADQMESIGAELRDDFGFEVSLVHADGVNGTVPPEVAEADVLATTTYHAKEMADVAARLGIPLVVILLNPQFVREVERTLEAGGLAVVCVDPLFAARLRVIAGECHPERVRTVLASDRAEVAALALSQPVLVSEAARRQLPGVPLPRSFPDQPMISPQSAEELAELLVRINLAGGRAREP